MNAWKVTLPLAIATLLAGLIIGFTSVSIVPSGTSTCGSAFNDKQGWNSENEQAACTPILSERDAWGTTLVFIGFGLFGATYLLNGPELISRLARGSKKQANQNVWPPPGPPGGYKQGPDGGWVWEPQGQPPRRRLPATASERHGGPPPNQPRPPQ